MYEAAMESSFSSSANDDLLALLAPVTEGDAEAEAKEGELVTDAEMAAGLDELPLPSDPVVRQLPSRAIVLPAASSDILIAGDPLTTYLAQLKQVEVLPADRQQALAERYHASGDVEAARALIMSNLRLVVKIAHQYQRRNGQLMEIIQEGNIGLAEAVRRYDPYRGVKFTSYAQYWVKAMILNYLMNTMQLIKVGNTRAGRRLFYNLQKARRELEAQGLLSPTTRQIADHLGVDEREVIDVGQVLNVKPVSFDAPVGEPGSKTYADVIADTQQMAPDEEVAQRRLQEQIRVAFDTFRAGLKTDRERAIWDRRVANDEPESLQEIGETFNVSRERIRQIEKTLKEDFRAYWVNTVGQADADLLLID